MPIYKYYSNRFLSSLQNLITGENLSEWHTEYESYKREVLESIKYKDFF